MAYGKNHTQIIADFIESHGKYNEMPTKVRNNMIVATAAEMAKTYIKWCVAKASSTESTLSNTLWKQPLHIGRFSPWIIWGPLCTNHWLGETMAQREKKYPPSDEEQGEHQNTSTTMGDTHWTFCQPVE